MECAAAVQMPRLGQKAVSMSLGPKGSLFYSRWGYREGG